VIQIASTAGLVGYPFTAAYTAAKHGMVGLTRALAAELNTESPRMYAICPGFVDTDITHQAAADIASRGRKTETEALKALAAMNSIGRLHTAAEVADAVMHLIQDQPPGCVYNLDSEPPTFV
jgi:NAD(P)-dependent dehydrogenase (short-subunit alcohol dehydrogenase family)